MHWAWAHGVKAAANKDNAASLECTGVAVKCRFWRPWKGRGGQLDPGWSRRLSRSKVRC